MTTRLVGKHRWHPVLLRLQSPLKELSNTQSRLVSCYMDYMHVLYTQTQYDDDLLTLPINGYDKSELLLFTALIVHFVEIYTNPQIPQALAKNLTSL